VTTTETAIKKTANGSYKVVIKSVHPKGYWGHSEISIFAVDNGGSEHELGGYTRNYPAHGLGTWYPFSRGSKDYALYSRDYTSTRLMELPSCKDISGEEPGSGGFCPVEYYIPEIDDFKKAPDPNKEGSFVYHAVKEPAQIALVAGCIWGDDSSWKIQCFDISQVESGILTRDERFGYVPMPRGITLAQSVYVQRDEESGAVLATFAVMQTYNLDTGEIAAVDPFR
jgi:hypothetical protein